LSDNYYDSVQKTFDVAADRYDDDERKSVVRRIMRIRSLELLKATFRAGQRMLEISCGTGTEAIELAKLGIRIVATDISRQMISRTKQRVEKEQLQDTIHVSQLAAHEIGVLQARYGPESFDGAYSSFGALNCEPRLKEVVSSLTDLLKPRSSFICSVINKLCLFDFAVNSLLWKKTDRFANLSPHLGSGELLPRYYSVREFRRIFQGYAVAGVRALPTLLPPPYFKRHVGWLRPAILAISPLDWKLGRFYPFNRIGDHFIVTFRKLNGE
jgi:ubiquinone/menaquinone biosynthesis C-methylase UbiE